MTIKFRNAFERAYLSDDPPRRREALERVGLKWFFETFHPQRSVVEDTDVDGAGNRRELLRVEMEMDEPLVVVHVIDPSTREHYYLRVPPDTASCKEAVAWTFGLDAGRYAPRVES